MIYQFYYRNLFRKDLSKFILIDLININKNF